MPSMFLLSPLHRLAVVCRLVTMMAVSCFFTAGGSAATADDSWLSAYRQRLMAKEGSDRYGLHLDGDQPTTNPLVIFVHGYNASPRSLDTLKKTAAAAGHSCGAFAYPNDQAISESAALLAKELQRYSQEWPASRIAFVTHSMGGLVARACIEDASLDPGNVATLVMIAPPTQGSKLADYAIGTDVWEHGFARSGGSPWRRAKNAILDGLGQASHDLQPGSAFLRGLNDRPRNPDVRYTILLGSQGPASLGLRNQISAAGVATLSRLRAKRSAARYEKYVSDFHEVVDGLGDGVVAIKRGRLAGVSDTHILPFDHLGVTKDHDRAASVHKLVLSRLGAPRSLESPSTESPRDTLPSPRHHAGLGRANH